MSSGAGGSRSFRSMSGSPRRERRAIVDRAAPSLPRDRGRDLVRDRRVPSTSGSARRRDQRNERHSEARRSLTPGAPCRARRVGRRARCSGPTTSGSPASPGPRGRVARLLRRGGRQQPIEVHPRSIPIGSSVGAVLGERRADHGPRLVVDIGDLTGCPSLVGGGALDPILRAARSPAALAIVTTYGLTETCGGIAYDGVPSSKGPARASTPQGGRAPRPDADGRLSA